MCNYYFVCARRNDVSVSVQIVNSKCLVKMHKPMTVHVKLNNKRDKHLWLPAKCSLQARKFSCHRSNMTR